MQKCWREGERGGKGDALDRLEKTAPRSRLGEIGRRVEHFADRAGDAGGVARDDEFEAVGGDEGDVGGGGRGGHFC